MFSKFTLYHKQNQVKSKEIFHFLLNVPASIGMYRRFFCRFVYKKRPFIKTGVFFCKSDSRIIQSESRRPLDLLDSAYRHYGRPVPATAHRLGTPAEGRRR